MNMKRILINTGIGVTLIGIGVIILYIGFLKDYLAMQAGEADSMRYQMRILVGVPMCIVFGTLTIFMQPDYSGFGPWKRATAKSKHFILTGMLLTLLCSAGFFYFVAFMHDPNSAFKDRPVAELSPQLQSLEEEVANSMREKGFAEREIDDQLTRLRQSASGLGEAQRQIFYESYLTTLTYTKNQ
jgi:hypothetical protein